MFKIVPSPVGCYISVKVAILGIPLDVNGQFPFQRVNKVSLLKRRRYGNVRILPRNAQPLGSRLSNSFISIQLDRFLFPWLFGDFVNDLLRINTRFLPPVVVEKLLQIFHYFGFTATRRHQRISVEFKFS